MIPDDFEFHHHEELNFIYTARKFGESKYLIQWNQNGEMGSEYYDVKDVQRLINNEVWVIK